MQRFYLDNKLKMTAGSAQIMLDCYRECTHLTCWEPVSKATYWIFMHQYMGTNFDINNRYMDRAGLMR